MTTVTVSGITSNCNHLVFLPSGSQTCTGAAFASATQLGGTISNGAISVQLFTTGLYKTCLSTLASPGVDDHFEYPSAVVHHPRTSAFTAPVLATAPFAAAAFATAAAALTTAAAIAASALAPAAAALASTCATTHDMWAGHDMRPWHLLQLHHPTVRDCVRPKKWPALVTAHADPWRSAARREQLPRGTSGGRREHQG